MKGLLNGLRYISQIFDAKEPEMKIGNPTDVKHVAHIGWDNASSVTAPSWMQDFKAAAPGATSSSSRGGSEPGEEGASGDKTDQRPRRTSKGKGAGASNEAKRRDRRPATKAETDGDDAATKQRRRKPRASTSSGCRSSSGSGGASDSAADNDRKG